MPDKESFLTQGPVTGSKVLSSDSLRDSTIKYTAFSPLTCPTVDASKVGWEDLNTLSDKYSACSLSDISDFDAFGEFADSPPTNLDSMIMDYLGEDDGTESEKSKLTPSQSLEVFNKLDAYILGLKDNYTSTNSETVDKSNSVFDLENVSNFFDSYTSIIKDFGKGNFEEDIEQTTQSKQSSKESSNTVEDGMKRENTSTISKITADKLNLIVIDAKSFSESILGIHRLDSSVISSYLNKVARKRKVSNENEKIIGKSKLAKFTNVKMQAKLTRSSKKAEERRIKLTSARPKADEKLANLAKIHAELTRSTKKAEERLTELTSAIQKAKDKLTKLDKMLTKLVKMQAELTRSTNKDEERRTKLTSTIQKTKDKHTTLASTGHKAKKRHIKLSSVIQNNITQISMNPNHKDEERRTKLTNTFQKTKDKHTKLASTGHKAKKRHIKLSSVIQNNITQISMNPNPSHIIDFNFHIFGTKNGHILFKKTGFFK